MRTFVVLLLLAACTAPQSEDNMPAIQAIISDVNVLNVRDGVVEEGRHVLIDSGKIVRIMEAEASLPPADTVISGSGKYLMPGLAEMHAHIPSPEWGRNLTSETLFLYLSNGVTTIRGMLGHPLHLELREQAEKNEILSPRIYTSSPSLNGNTVPSPEEARQKVTEYHQAGYDFLKLHPGIQLEVFDEIVRTAKALGIPYAGHVSVHVGIRHALESDYASVDHVDGFLEGLVPESANVAPDANGFFGYNFTRLADTLMISELVSMSRENGVWVVPTQSLFDRWFSPESPETLVQAPEMKYMPASTLESWVNSKKGLVTDATYTAGQWEAFNEIRKKMIYQLHQQGQGLLLGSDAPQVFNVPGFSIHHELQGMLDAGLSPAEAIRIGTLNPAVFFGREGDFGEVVEGASADLILLPANPLEDLSHLKNLEGVMVRGRWLSRTEIDKRLAEIAQNAKEM
jgi:imidazolonepropionase-like amidohydrolase